jgi:hypothetical protein
LLLVAGALTPTPRRVLLLDAGLMVLAYGVPAWWLGHARAALRAWWAFLLWVLLLAVVWDAASASLGGRRFLSEWWLVYPASVLFFGALYAAHASVTHRLVRRRAP